MKYVFVLGVGRSGTTILQHLLNATPGICIRGENGGAIWPLVETYGRVLTSSIGDGKWAQSWSGDPWFGFNEVSPSALAVALRHTFVSQILNPPPDTEVIGFKEIRFPSENLVEKVELISQVFPNSRFILNFRSRESILKSGWWSDDRKSRKLISRQINQLSNLGRVLGERSFSVVYESFYTDEQERIRLFQWLGVAYDSCVVDQAIKTRLNHLKPSQNVRPS